MRKLEISRIYLIRKDVYNPSDPLSTPECIAIKRYFDKDQYGCQVKGDNCDSHKAKELLLKGIVSITKKAIFRKDVMILKRIKFIRQVGKCIEKRLTCL